MYYSVPLGTEIYEIKSGQSSQGTKTQLNNSLSLQASVMILTAFTIILNI